MGPRIIYSTNNVPETDGTSDGTFQVMLCPVLEIAVIGLVFLAPKVAFSWPSADRIGKQFLGLMI